MIIRNIIHKGLRLLIEVGDKSGVPPNLVARLHIMVAVLQSVPSEKALERLPSWHPHRLSGNMKGYWSLSVSRNWRLTFRVNDKEAEILDLDFQDYH